MCNGPKQRNGEKQHSTVVFHSFGVKFVLDMPLLLCFALHLGLGIEEAEYWHADLPADQKRAVHARIDAGCLLFLFMSPEKVWLANAQLHATRAPCPVT